MLIHNQLAKGWFWLSKNGCFKQPNVPFCTTERHVWHPKICIPGFWYRICNDVSMPSSFALGGIAVMHEMACCILLMGFQATVRSYIIVWLSR